MQRDSGVISKIIQRPCQKHVDAYEAWLKEIIPVAKEFEGHKGVNIIRPHKGHSDYTIALHFESETTLAEWLNSSERKRLIEKVRPLPISSF